MNGTSYSQMHVLMQDFNYYICLGPLGKYPELPSNCIVTPSNHLKHLSN